MRVRNITTCALGLAAALTLASEMSAQQQDTSRLRTSSDRRINVSKGEVAARVDTVYITRYDTVRVNNTIVRVDTVTVATPQLVMPVKVTGPMYWGVFAGATQPWGNIDRLYTNGFHAGGVLGWEPQHGFLGLRLDGAMSQINREQGRATALIGTGTPLMLHLAGDVKVKPLNFGGYAIYGIGGLNYNRYKRIATAASASNATHCGAQWDGARAPDNGPGCYTAAEDTRWSDKFGFNIGTGVDFHIGSQDMFLEARWMAMQTDGARTWTLPISLGVRYF